MSTSDIPEYLRGVLLNVDALSNGLSCAPTLPEVDQKSYLFLSEAIDEGIEVFIQATGAVGAHIKLKGKGFGKHFVKRLKND